MRKYSKQVVMRMGDADMQSLEVLCVHHRLNHSALIRTLIAKEAREVARADAMLTEMTGKACTCPQVAPAFCLRHGDKQLHSGAKA